MSTATMARFFHAMLMFALFFYGKHLISPTHLKASGNAFDVDSLTLTPINDPNTTGTLPSAIYWLNHGQHRKIISPYYRSNPGGYLTIITLLLSGQVETNPGPPPKYPVLLPLVSYCDGRQRRSEVPEHEQGSTSCERSSTRVL